MSAVAMSSSTRRTLWWVSEKLLPIGAPSIWPTNSETTIGEPDSRITDAARRARGPLLLHSLTDGTDAAPARVIRRVMVSIRKRHWTSAIHLPDAGCVT